YGDFNVREKYIEEHNRIKNELSDCKKRYDKLIKTVEEGNINPKNVNERLNELNENIVYLRSQEEKTKRQLQERRILS
ncbi:MAG: hypothetical protein ABEH43_01945, partial [Flavobacteriales bacterium]